GNAPLPGWALAGQPSGPPTAQAQPPARSEPPGQEVVAVDRLFASLNKGDAGPAWSEPVRLARADVNSRALDPWGGDDPPRICGVSGAPGWRTGRAKGVPERPWATGCGSGRPFAGPGPVGGGPHPPGQVPRLRLGQPNHARP